MKEGYVAVIPIRRLTERNLLLLAAPENKAVSSPLPARVHSNEGLCQIVFFDSDEVCRTSYKDKKGEVSGAKGYRPASNLKAAERGVRE